MTSDLTRPYIYACKVIIISMLTLGTMLLPKLMSSTAGMTELYNHSTETSSSSSLPASPPFYCCDLSPWYNSGHKLTEAVLAVHRCGPVIHVMGDRDRKAAHSHLVQIAGLVGTKLLSKEDCIAFYTRKPHLHPAKKNLQAYFEMYRVYRARYRCKEPGEKHWFCELAYDAVEVANGLRRMQGKVLSSCGMDTPTYKKFNLGVDNKSESRENDAGLYEQLVDRQPAKSVTIIRRRYDRQLLNTQEILTMCQSLNLVCRIFDSGSIFNTEKARDVCFILKHFKDAVTIGVQGAEIVYPHYTHGRLILVVPDRLDQHSTTIHAARFGNHPGLGEVQLARDFIAHEPLGDRFFFEFAAHFGNSLKYVGSKLDEASLAHIKSTPEEHSNPCVEDPSYCADLRGNTVQIQAELERLISDGELLLA